MAVCAAFSILAMLEVAQSFTPYCSMETNEISSCSISEIEAIFMTKFNNNVFNKKKLFLIGINGKYQDNDLLLFPASEFVLNRSYVNVTAGYINATFSFSTYKEAVWQLLVYVNKKVESIWIIQSMDCSKQVPKGTVHLHFLPVSDNFTHLILKILKQETDVLCRDSMHSEVCSNLSYAFLALQSHALQSDDHHVFKFENKQPGFYCVRVYPEYSCMGNDCCTFGTNATYHPGEKMKPIPHELLPDLEKPPIDMILVVLCITMAVVVVVSFIKFKSIKKMRGDVECLTAEGALFISRNLPSYTTLDVQSYSPVLISTPSTSCPNKVEVFLLYSRQSEDFLNKMNDFRKRLEENCIVVYDINCVELEEQINRDGVAWVEKVLNNNNMKYILVEHREAVVRYKEWIENTKAANTDDREPHHLDQLFLYALSSIHNKFVEDKCIAHDYCRLFVVNYQDANEMSYKYTNLVPFKRYCINNDRDDDHYLQLIQDLSIKVCSSESIL